MSRPLNLIPAICLALLLPAAARAQAPSSPSGPAAGAEPACSPRIDGPRVRVGERTFVSRATRVEPATADGCVPEALVVDAEAPVIEWRTGDRPGLAGRLAPDSERDRRRLRGRRSGGQPARDSWESEAGVWRVPLPWDRARKGESRMDGFPVEIASDDPQAFFAAPGASVMDDGFPADLGDRLVWVTARDAGAGVDRMTFRTRTEPDRVVLEIEAVDLVGNQAKREIVLNRTAASQELRGGKR